MICGLDYRVGITLFSVIETKLLPITITNQNSKILATLSGIFWNVSCEMALQRGLGFPVYFCQHRPLKASIQPTCSGAPLANI